MRQYNILIHFFYKMDAERFELTVTAKFSCEELRKEGLKENLENNEFALCLKSRKRKMHIAKS